MSLFYYDMDLNSQHKSTRLNYNY